MFIKNDVCDWKKNWLKIMIMVEKNYEIELFGWIS